MASPKLIVILLIVACLSLVLAAPLPVERRSLQKRCQKEKSHENNSGYYRDDGRDNEREDRDNEREDRDNEREDRDNEREDRRYGRGRHGRDDDDEERHRGHRGGRGGRHDDDDEDEESHPTTTETEDWEPTTTTEAWEPTVTTTKEHKPTHTPEDEWEPTTTTTTTTTTKTRTPKPTPTTTTEDDWEPTTTTTKPRTTTTTKKPEPTDDGSNGGGSGGDFSGEGTWYDVGLGSCGTTNSDSEYVAALNYIQMENGANPNNNPKCGNKLKINGPKGSVTVTIVDTCPTCAYGDVDLSPAAFQKLADLNDGRININWSFA